MRVHIFGGGTHFHVRPHLALCAPAYGGTAKRIRELCCGPWLARDVELHLTRMAGGDVLDTNEDVARAVRRIVGEPETRVVFMSAALCDFEGAIEDSEGALTPSGKSQQRLRTSDGEQLLRLVPTVKVLREVRRERKDIFLVGFKTTAGATADEQFEAGLKLLKESSCNLVLANDVHTRLNMIVTPEQARYCVTENRNKVLTELVAMAHARSRLHFTRSTVVPGDVVPWESVSPALRGVVEGLVARGAYRPFLHKTVGHFAEKIGPGKFVTSARGSDFNHIDAIGMVRVELRGEDEVVAYGRKPSVGGQSQRAIFAKIPEATSIAHAHVQLRPGSKVPVRSQREFECGSHECGENTAHGLARFGKIWAVMLDKHGPNIVFNKDEVTAEEVLAFIDENFDTSKQTSELS